MFGVTAQDGLARCGNLITRHAAVATPTAMLYTRRGGSMYLTPDMLAKLRPEAQLLQVNVMQFLEHPNADLLLKFGKSLHHFIGVPEWPLLASNRDATLVEYVANRPASNVSAYVSTHSGATMVTPERYMKTVHAMQPELFVVMADEVVADVGKKRLAASVERTTKWLDACLELHAQACQQQAAAAPAQASSNTSATPAAAAGAKGGGGTVPALLAPIVGATNMAAREKSAKEAAARQGVEGYALCGFGMGESPQQQAEAITTMVQQLPPDKLRLAVGLGSIEEVVQAVARGVDLFDCSYPQAVTSGGYALCFPWSPDHAASLAAAAAAAAAAAPATAGSADSRGAGAAAAVSAAASPGQSRSSVAAVAAAAAAAGVDVGTDDTKLNLWSVQYRLDNGPLVPGCTCFCCANHTRAYLHHLLHTHEMLGGVLLEMHNTHWWLGFFHAMRSAIQQGEWAAYQQWVLQRRVSRSQGQLNQQQKLAAVS